MTTDFLRPAVRGMRAYQPGEQPQAGKVIKLNTNENPYPPSPEVFAAIQKALHADRLRKYPDPTGYGFRSVAAHVLGVEPECILIGNGSDDLLTIITRAMVPEGGLVVSPTPSYLLYRTLAQIQGARHVEIPFDHDWRIQPDSLPRDTSLTLIANPNSPTGTMIPPETLAEWPTPLILDEAYVEFADSDGLRLWRGNPRILVTRSLSKSYSLAGIRFGFAIGHPDLIAELHKVKDSYNCDALSQAAATAALADQAHMLRNREAILRTREVLHRGLCELGFEVLPSHANFVWCRHPYMESQAIYQALKEQQILVRYLSYPGYGDGLRISVGTDEETTALQAAMTKMLESSGTDKNRKEIIAIADNRGTMQSES